MAESVYIIGVGRTDFKRNFKKEGKGLREMIVEAAQGAIGNAGIDAGEIQAGIVGNFAGGLFSRQLHLGAYLTEVDVKLRGLPTMHTEAACASGSVAVLTAAKFIMGNIHDVVLVVGAEQQKTMSPAEGSDVLGAAGDYASEKAFYGEYMFPKLFAQITQVYRDRHGLTERQLALLSAKNHAHARLNPLAQMRDSKLTLEQACTESNDNPRFAPPLKITDCSQITDGAAAVVVCSERFLRKISGKGIRLLGFGHATDHIALADKDAPDFPVSRLAAIQAYKMSGLQPRDIHGAEVHDCFSISEILAYEFLGFAERGQGPKLLESGATMLPAVREEFSAINPGVSIPVNPSGGLIGDGHPVGATGVRQIVECHQQLMGLAGARQIEGAQRFMTFNMGGTLTTNVAMIWGL